MPTPDQGQDQSTNPGNDWDPEEPTPQTGRDGEGDRADDDRRTNPAGSDWHLRADGSIDATGSDAISDAGSTQDATDWSGEPVIGDTVFGADEAPDGPQDGPGDRAGSTDAGRLDFEAHDEPVIGAPESVGDEPDWSRSLPDETHATPGQFEPNRPAPRSSIESPDSAIPTNDRHDDGMADAPVIGEAIPAPQVPDTWQSDVPQRRVDPAIEPAIGAGSDDAPPPSDDERMWARPLPSDSPGPAIGSSERPLRSSPPPPPALPRPDRDEDDAADAERTPETPGAGQAAFRPSGSPYGVRGFAPQRGTDAAYGAGTAPEPTPAPPAPEPEDDDRWGEAEPAAHAWDEEDWGEPAGAATATRAAERTSRIRTLVRDVVEMTLLGLLVFLVVKASVHRYRVEGESMFPTIEDGQQFLVNQLAYAEVDVSAIPGVDGGDDPMRDVFGGPGRGDIIVFSDPRGGPQDLIKRIIGLPGETVEVRDGAVYVNGYHLVEDYITTPWGGSRDPLTLGEDEYFVMGDNRGNSTDSRVFGAVDRELIIGKALAGVWPPDNWGLAPNHDPECEEQADCKLPAATVAAP